MTAERPPLDLSGKSIEEAYWLGWDQGFDDALDPTLQAMDMGSRGGLRGGPARAASLTPERRSEIARAAAQQRWSRLQD